MKNRREARGRGAPTLAVEAQQVPGGRGQVDRQGCPGAGASVLSQASPPPSVPGPGSLCTWTSRSKLDGLIPPSEGGGSVQRGRTPRASGSLGLHSRSQPLLGIFHSLGAVTTIPQPTRFPGGGGCSFPAASLAQTSPPSPPLPLSRLPTSPPLCHHHPGSKF